MDDDIDWTPFRLFTRESLFNIERRIAEEQAAKEAEKTHHGDSSDDDDDEVEEPAHEQEPQPNPKLEAGRKLPPSLEDVPPEYVARPVEDLDEYYHNQKTFVVLSKDKSIYRFSATNAIFLLTPFNPIRRIAIYILVHPLFNILVMLTIVVNCVFMTLTSWQPPAYVENIFLGIYTVEAVVKLLARGFILQPFTFLRDPWNWLDFFVICSAYLTMAITELQGLAALRTFRVLRALKTVAVVPGLKTIVGALLEAVRRLRDVMILTVFMLSIFALIGMQLYTGSLRHKCVRNWTEVLGTNISDQDWYDFVWEPSNWQLDFYENIEVCGNGSGAGGCKVDKELNISYICVPDVGENPNFGYTSFDNFAMALLCAFRLMTQDFWESLYHLILRAEGSAHALYFGLVILLGSFYLVNLILAIVAMSYDETQKQDAADAEEEAAERQQVEDKQSVLTRSRSPSECSDMYDPGVHERGSVASGVSAGSHLKPYDYQKRASLSLPASPYLKGNRRSTQFSWKKNKYLHSNDRQPLVNRNLEAIPLPFIDDSAAVTPSTEDLCHSPFLHKNLPNGRRFSFANLSLYRHPLAAGRSGSRRSSVASQYSRSSRSSRHSRDGRSKMETLLLFNKSKSKAPDVVLDTSKLDDTLCKGDNTDDSDGWRASINSMDSQAAAEKKKMSGSHSFLNSSPTGQNVEIKDVLVLKNILDQATEHRHSFTSMRSEPQETLKTKLWHICCMWDCCDWFIRVQELTSLFIMDAFVDLFITLCIVVNTLFMALDRHKPPPGQAVVAAAANELFTAIFAAEAFFKILAMAPSRYFKDGWNIFDFFIVALSLAELGFKGLPGLSVLRAFRLLRVFKLAKSWPTLNMLISIVARTVSAIGNLVIVLGIVVFIFAVMGQQLFGDEYKDFANETLFPEKGGEMPRWNFCDFMHSFMIVFRVLCGEWIESMWNCIEVAGWSCVPFFLLTMIIGNLVVLNLFLALLLSSFGSENLQKSETEEEVNKLAEAINRFKRFGSWVKVKVIVCLKVRLKHGKNAKPPPANMQVSPELNGKEPLVDGVNVVEKTPDDFPDGAKISLSRASSINSHKKPLKSPTGSVASSASSSSISTDHGMDKVQADGDPEINEVDVVYKKEPDDCLCKVCMKQPLCQSLSNSNLGQKWWKVRCFMFGVTEHKYFETFIIAMILVSSVALAFEDVHLPERPILKDILTYMDYCFTAIFIGEMLVKWLAFGYKVYFTDAWCWLDFIIVALSIFLLAMKSLGMDNMSSIKSLRTLRALRPLRAVSRWEGMRVVVNALIKAIPSICNVMLVCVVFWLIFGIMGVQLFSGQFYACYYPENNTRVSVNIVNTSDDCKSLNYTWVNAKVNFDDVLQAYLALFQVATYKGWIDIMNCAIDARGEDMQPDREVNIYSYIYFVLFIILGSFFTLNLFIGVIIENFNSQKKKAGGSLELFMTDDQKKYYQAMKKMSSKSPQKSIPKPKLKFAALIFDLTTDQKFDIAIMMIIMLNMLTMTLEFYGMPQEMKDVLQIVNIIFIAIFTLECVLKLIGLRFYYFKIPWNVFDFVVVVLSILASSLSEFEDSFFISPTLLRVIRVFRVGRVLRLVKSAKGIRTLLFSLAVSLPALFNIGLLLVLVMFIYAIMGMNFFMNAPHEYGLDDAFNFQTFLSSFILLFQMCTSAGWSDVMNGLIAKCPPNGACTMYTLATLYLSSYLIMSFLVVVNMYIAVILENFSQATEDVQHGLMPEDFDMYYEKWEKYDPKATKYIPLDQLSDFVDFLDEPLRLAKPNHFLLVKMEIPICEGDKCFCRDILDALTKNFLGTSDTSSVPAKAGDDKDESYVMISNTLRRQKEHYAARIIQKAYRNFKRKDDDDEDDGVDVGGGGGGGRGDKGEKASAVSGGSGQSGSADTSSTVHPGDEDGGVGPGGLHGGDGVDSRSVELGPDSGVVA
ncbi:sodium channel protein para-like [Babylonia areolata]|uniref:sodium channel protein para-like n=1 Tax=Babylonia areolata TaxID=304850 RepID=UPI003FD23DA6